MSENLFTDKPVHDTAHALGAVAGVLSAMVTAAAGHSLLGGSKSRATVLGVLSGLAAFAAAKSVAVKVTPLVTPLDNPVNRAGFRLRPVDETGKLISPK